MLKNEAASLLAELNLGSGVAENDDLLETARVETSVFDDLILDRVDLVPGTKGSGKTALYRIFVDFLPDLLLKSRKVVIAHGVQLRQDTVFLAYRDQFDKLSQEDFVDFWCIYLISLAYEQFIRSKQHSDQLDNCFAEINKFREQYRKANIPEFEKRLTLKEIIGWALAVVKKNKPKVTWTPPGDVGQFELSLPTDTKPHDENADSGHAVMPQRIDALTTSLEELLSKADLSLWLMIDRLDELFARRSETEQKALRGLLNTLRLFRSDRIRIKVFLRDDILEHIVSSGGFTALSHVTARKSDTLRWSEEQILTMVVRRIFVSSKLRKKFAANLDLLKSNVEYQRTLFYKVFADTVYRPTKQSSTLRWIYNHTKDGRGVVTPRDVIFLLSRACQRQRDLFRQDPQGKTQKLVHGPAIIYGLEELSKEKRTVYLEAEFPHKWPEIRKLLGGGTEYSEAAMKRLYGTKYEQSMEDLLSLGIIERATRKGEQSFKIPFLYRHGLECTQRFVSK
ncbi:MAG TPA: hypothetical protein VMX97_08625 [Hyphomicrobiaceae bacterium]|nr:hypothetical protein [Hyphomicrobiaceae bacterium]